MKILHTIAHALRWNKGRPYSFYDDKGRLMMSFLCEGCGKMQGVHHIDALIDRLLPAHMSEPQKHD